MPDHLHVFAAPCPLEITLENWIKYWKSQFTKKRRIVDQRWQVNHWDTRMRSGESYDDKWSYVRENPVRAGLVASAEDWPYQGELNILAWS
jgi:putative transposase